MTTGVLVMAYGTPGSPGEVEAYYTRIRHGRAPTPELLADLVRRYDAIGGISPLAERTLAQVAGITAVLDREAPGTYVVRSGSKYQPPLLEDAAAELLDLGVTRVVALVLAPHESSMSTDQYLARAAAALGERAELVAIRAWWDNEEFLALIAERVRTALAAVPKERAASTEVIFSAHSLPQRILDIGDTYPDQLRESARRAAELGGVERWDVAWQSAGRTAEPWIGPDILQVLREKSARGVSDIVVCPIGFVADHLEVLFDLDVEAAGVARELGLGFSRTASLNDDPRFVAMLAHVIQRAA